MLLTVLLPRSRRVRYQGTARETTTAIEIRGLRKAFKGVDAVCGVDLDVGAAEIFGLLGPNGAGKTTTLRMASTLIRPDAGELRVAGVDARRQPRLARHRIGYAAQGSTTWDECTARQELINQARMHRLSKKDARWRAELMIQRFALTDFADRRCRTYSGGQRRRVELALAIIHGPIVLMLDEPTAGLDPQSRADLWEEIRALRAEGITVLFTTHYLDEADALCDRVAIMDRGRVVALGTPSELKREIAHDQVTIELEDSRSEAVRMLTGLPGIDYLASDDDGLLRFSVMEASHAVPVIMRTLEAAGICLRAIESRRPSLDDVFLARTGRRLRDS